MRLDHAPSLRKPYPVHSAFQMVLAERMCRGGLDTSCTILTVMAQGGAPQTTVAGAVARWSRGGSILQHNYAVMCIQKNTTSVHIYEIVPNPISPTGRYTYWGGNDCIIRRWKRGLDLPEPHVAYVHSLAALRTSFIPHRHILVEVS